VDMVERILSRAVDQVPALVVLAILCLLFLRSQKGTLAQFGTMLDAQRGAFVAALKTRDDIGAAECQDCHQVTEAARLAVVENSRVLGGVEAGLAETRVVLKATADVVKDCQRRTA